MIATNNGVENILINTKQFLKEFTGDEWVISAFPKNETDVADLSDHELFAERIIIAVAEATHIHQNSIKGKCRKREYTEPRFIAMWFIVKNTPLSLKRIGRLFCMRDHSTVIHAKETCDDLLLTNPDFTAKFKACEKRLREQKLLRNLITV